MRTTIKILVKFNLAILACCVIAVSGCAQSQKKPPKTKKSIAIKTQPLYQQKEVKKFIDEMVKQHDFKRAQLIKLFKQVQIKQQILNKIKHPYEEVPWNEYQQHFITQQRIDGGVKFWHKYAATLKRAYLEFGIPPSIIVAIIGVESKYGKKTGEFKVINALSTIGFKYPERAEYFKKELAQFLLFCRENKINPLKVYGSYAGAIGQPQFMPSNVRAYAVDFDKSGKIDLINDAKDSIGSIANFFQAHGWQEDSSIALKAKFTNHLSAKNLTKFLTQREPKFTLAQLAKYNIEPVVTIPSNTLANVIKLQGKNNPLYWLGFHNMYVIMTYNTNIQYAMAVYQLSQEIKKAYLQSLKTRIGNGALHNHKATNKAL
ncbi:MAG: lytic murein transglycosylase B [Gammaproteobacteria bacterium]